MPRVRTARAIRPVAHIDLQSSSVSLQSYPSSDPHTQLTVPSEVLSHQLFSRPNANRVFRQRFGRGLDMDRIQLALNEAYRGGMRQLTDIARETIDVDPHLGSVLNKRFGSLSALPWEVQPAIGVNVDSDRAMFYAEVAREQLMNLKNFRKSLRQLAWALYDGRACLEIKWRQLPASQTVTHPKFGRASWVIESLAWIHPRRLSFGPHRQLQIENEEDGQSFQGNFARQGLQVDTLPNKFVYWMPQLYAEYPEREGLAPRCLYWSFFKRFGARERMMLAELMGKPWRIIEVDQESTAGQPEMEAADEIVDALGASYTARLPRGTKLNVIQPDSSSGSIHTDIIKSSDEQISKLVLGQTGTTDGTPAGLNNNQASVMQDEQLMILVGDAHGLSEIIETFITDRIIALNFGEDSTPHAPKFRLRSDIPADRKSELERLQLTLDAGLSVKLDEAYEVSGFSQPNPETDIILRTEQPPTPPGAPNAPNPRPVIVFPTGGSPAQGEQQPSPATAALEEGSRDDATADIVLTASDLGTVITVNEARSSQGLEPLKLPSGQIDPDGDLTIADFKTKKAANATAPRDGDGDDGDGDDGDGDGDDGDDGDGGPGPVPPQFLAAPEISAETTLAKMREVLLALHGFGEPESDIPNDFVIIETGGLFVIETPSGRRMGSYKTREDAEVRMRQLVFFRDQGSNAAALIDALDDFGNVEAEHDECGHVHLATDFTQQSSPTGDPEDLVSRGEDELAPIFVDLVSRYKRKVKKLTAPSEIFQALNEVWAEFNTGTLAGVLRKHMAQSMMMGALDSRAQQEGELVRDQSKATVDEEGATPASALAEFVDNNVFLLTADGEDGITINLAAGDPIPDFGRMAFKEATDFFKSLNVMSSTEFATATADVRRLSFTVAGNYSDQMLALIQAELVTQIEAGTSLVEFSAALEARMESAGFLQTLQSSGKLRAAHIETVFRTNTLNAYNAGRARQASQPNVARVFPVWEIRTARDGRVRDSHKALNGTKLLASDPFWQSNYPPFDYNCRCRVISRRSTSGVVEGSTVTEPGTGSFVSGTAVLI